MRLTVRPMIEGISDGLVQTVGSMLFWSAIVLVAVALIRVWQNR